MFRTLQNKLQKCCVGVGQFGFSKMRIALQQAIVAPYLHTLGKHFVKRATLELGSSKWAIDLRAVMGTFAIFDHENNNAKTISI